MKHFITGLLILVPIFLVLNTLPTEVHVMVTALASGWTYGTIASFLAKKVLGEPKDEQ